MAKYDLNLTFEVTKNGEKHSSGNNSWYGMDAEGLAAMLGHAAKAEAAVQKSASKGGPLTIALGGSVTSPDGAAIPPGVNLNPAPYSGVTRHGLSDIQDEMHKIGNDVKKMGRDHAAKKEGKKHP